MSNTINDTVGNQTGHTESIEFQPLDMSVFTPEEAVALLLDRASRIRASDLFLVTNEHDVSAYVRHLGFVKLITKTGIEEGRRWM
ncbi:MAG TPA: hypothetical protein VNQ74_01135 [Burkholderiaceae bacterium]|nr:hypothetical protein [Burkholderiaceae bacterium]